MVKFNWPQLEKIKKKLLQVRECDKDQDSQTTSRPQTVVPAGTQEVVEHTQDSVPENIQDVGISDGGDLDEQVVGTQSGNMEAGASDFVLNDGVGMGVEGSIDNIPDAIEEVEIMEESSFLVDPSAQDEMNIDGIGVGDEAIVNTELRHGNLYVDYFKTLPL